ncbi:type IV pilus assembly protein PilC [Pseudidiomarina indica]|uniref:Type IV pilus assembly protein PilC n=1 Tax=Pseudidiomarina indica TaxID=1159017 RepID=A0A1G6BCJ3_9GAMM|nr:type II secretion system F family protein [Pseudidiomarina indica]SDB18335.1 type IV pilus assembly protein PilC [Pseudidiomarina indica]
MTTLTPPRRRQRQEPIRPSDILALTRQLATLLGAGIPVVNALELMAQGHRHHGVQQLLQQLAAAVKMGATLTQALRQHPIHFDALYCDLIACGEQTGQLEQLFSQVADYREQVAQARRQVRQACWYPVAILIFAVLVTSLLLVYVVPQFAAVFADFGAPLPWLTQQVLQLSAWVQRYGALLLGGSVLSILLARRHYRRHRQQQRRWDTLVLRLPWLGPLIQRMILARFTRTLAITLHAGVPMLSALQSSANACGNQYYQHQLAQVHYQVAQGIQLHAALQHQEIFPDLLIQMIFIGEESGSLDAMLNKMAAIYEREAQELISQLTRMLEPLFMVVIGGLVGSLIVAMYLPIFSLNKVIG